jgi:hypothetical protein
MLAGLKKKKPTGIIIICGFQGTAACLANRSENTGGAPCHVSFVCHLIFGFESTDFVQISGHLTVPNTQKRFFIRRRRIRLPYGSSDFGSFGIRPGKSPFNAAIRAFCSPGTQFRSKSGRTRLAANLPVPGALHNFIDFHFSNSFDVSGYEFLYSKLIVKHIVFTQPNIF